MPCGIDKNTCNKISLWDIYEYIIYGYLFVAYIPITAFYYFAFSGIISLTVYLLIYEWLSIFSENMVHIVLSIIANFTEFGLFYALFHTCYSAADFYFTTIKRVISFLSAGLKELYKNYFESMYDLLESRGIYFSHCCKNMLIVISIITSLGAGIGVIYLLFWIIIKKKTTVFIFSCVIESIFIFVYGILMAISFIVLYKLKKKNAENNKKNQELVQPILNEDSILSICNDTTDPINDPIDLNTLGMFDIDPNEKCPKCVHAYQIITSIIIILFQIYNTIYLPSKNSVKAGYIAAFVTVKIIYLPIILQYNFIDCVINCKRRFTAMFDKKEKIIFVALMILHVLLLGFFIAIYYISKKKVVFPKVNSARYFENNKKWYKMNGTQFIAPQGFCNIQSQMDGTLFTEDFAMMETLPRLYDVTKSGKCFIKPSMRGLFNSTMKYIFGNDYEKNGIEIFCKKMSHYPILIITSEKILNKTLSYFSENDTIRLLPKQFNITNTNYFENHEICDLPTEGNKLYNIYNNCVKSFGSANCENEWNEFEQFYWPNMYNADYIDIPGFERYQINIESNMKINPSFIVNEAEYWAGTHYIVGGSYEDHWGVGYFIETFGRQYVPNIFNNLLILYSFVKNVARDILLRMIWYNSKLFYFDIFSSKETNSLLELYSQFNFSHQSLFTIGHSISGTSFKVASFYSNIQGITFEASDGENNIVFLSNSKLRSKTNPAGQIANIFSKTGISSDFDKNCDINGILPKKYRLPNVYDTACMTAITCSKTEKYVPFCRQVLASNKKGSENAFNDSVNAFLKYYGYK